jgi:hypothetical protein
MVGNTTSHYHDAAKCPRNYTITRPDRFEGDTPSRALVAFKASERGERRGCEQGSLPAGIKRTDMPPH